MNYNIGYLQGDTVLRVNLCNKEKDINIAIFCVMKKFLKQGLKLNSSNLRMICYNLKALHN